MKDSELSPQDSSRLRVEVPLWLSWLNTSVSKQITQSYNNKTQVYQAYKNESNISMQDINKSERERDEQSQTRENYFEIRAPLLYVPAFNTMKDFH